ncbi:MAG: hypothetical protein GXO23_04605 [Crenarchaeota archaeon]|nr:hypothetical protein [Thermoproteota archaeon]
MGVSERMPQTLFIMGKTRPGQLERIMNTILSIIREGKGEPALLRVQDSEIGLAVRCSPEQRGRIVGLAKRGLEACRVLVDRSRNYIAFSSEPLGKALDDILRCGGSEVMLPFLFRLGHVYGRELVDILELSDEHLAERLITSLEYLKLAGFFRRFSVLHVSANRIEVAIEMEIKMPLIHFLRGVLSGLVSKIFGKSFTCTAHAKSENVVLFEIIPYR